VLRALIKATASDDRLLAGAFYVVDAAELARSRRFVEPGRTIGMSIPAERAIDVDEEHDLLAAEACSRRVPSGRSRSASGGSATARCS
jgi:hypothetical protein